jgi:hypothetical protein
MARAPNRARVRSHAPNAQADTSLAPVVRATTRLWRKHLNPFGRYHFDLERMRQTLDEPPSR